MPLTLPLVTSLYTGLLTDTSGFIFLLYLGINLNTFKLLSKKKVEVYIQK